MHPGSLLIAGVLALVAIFFSSQTKRTFPAYPHSKPAYYFAAWITGFLSFIFGWIGLGMPL
jgi:hypothetical protein